MNFPDFHITGQFFFLSPFPQAFLESISASSNSCSSQGCLNWAFSNLSCRDAKGRGCAASLCQPCPVNCCICSSGHTLCQPDTHPRPLFSELFSLKQVTPCPCDERFRCVHAEIWDHFAGPHLLKSLDQSVSVRHAIQYFLQNNTWFIFKASMTSFGVGETGFLIKMEHVIHVRAGTSTWMTLQNI